jgi:peptidoglycan/LPS O-acetylase OafA/YrhL
MNAPLAKNKSSEAAVSNHAHELIGIEVLRFLCAFVILVWHYQHFFFAGEYDGARAPAILPMLPFHGLLRFAYEQGFWAVEAFWAISGFIFYWRYARPILDHQVGLLEFATRRFSRLYPLHVFTLLVVALMQYLYFRSHRENFIYPNNSVGAFVAQLFFASNWFFWQTYSFNGPIWSISVEILIYFAFFWTIRAFGAAPIIATAAAALAWMLFRADLSALVLHQSVFECAILFFAGGLAQWLSSQRMALPLSVTVLAAVGALLAMHVVHLHFSVIVIFAVCLVLSFARLGEIRAGALFKRAAFLGNATYSSYLLHFPIQLALVIAVDAAGYSRAIFFSPTVMVAYLALVIVLSLAVYHLFELPAQKWIRGRAIRLRSTLPQEEQERIL